MKNNYVFKNKNEWWVALFYFFFLQVSVMSDSIEDSYFIYFCAQSVARCCFGWNIGRKSVTKCVKYDRYIKKWRSSPDQCGSVGWASSHKEKGGWFDSPSGQVPSWGRTRGNWLLLLSHIDVSLPLFLPPFPLSKNK